MEGIDDEKLAELFPLFSNHEFEANLNQTWPIGIDLDHPEELLNRLSAASLSVFLGNKSTDYVQKKYKIEYEFDPGGDVRRDRLIRGESLGSVESIVSGLRSHRESLDEESSIGDYLSDITIGRIPFSLGRAFAEADKGALYEAIVIARMIVEQLCWSLKIRGVNDAEKIKATSATKSITPISKKYPTIGRLNGWLSKHAHWGYDAHIKAAFDKPGFTVMASCRFKACAYVALAMLSFQVRHILLSEVRDFIDLEKVKEEDEFRRGDSEPVNLEKEALNTARLVVAQYYDIADLFAL